MAAESRKRRAQEKFSKEMQDLMERLYPIHEEKPPYNELATEETRQLDVIDDSIHFQQVGFQDAAKWQGRTVVMDLKNRKWYWMEFIPDKEALLQVYAQKEKGELAHTNELEETYGKQIEAVGSPFVYVNPDSKMFKLGDYYVYDHKDLMKGEFYTRLTT